MHMNLCSNCRRLLSAHCEKLELGSVFMAEGQVSSIYWIETRIVLNCFAIEIYFHLEFWHCIQREVPCRCLNSTKYP